MPISGAAMGAAVPLAQKTLAAQVA